MGRFHISIETPEEIIPRLGKQELHWKQGRSAYELSTAWMAAGGIPPSVRKVLDIAPEWRGAGLREGIFERETDLPGRGRPSQTDLLAIVSLPDGNAVLGVEGKVDESFGPLLIDWLNAAKGGNRVARLTGLCATLGVNIDSVGGLYYQLLHRTCAAIYEAQRFGYRRAIMLVHSFDARRPLPAWFPEFRAYSEAVGMPVAAPDTISPVKRCDGVAVRLGWVCDRVSD